MYADFTQVVFHDGGLVNHSICGRDHLIFVPSPCLLCVFVRLNCNWICSFTPQIKHLVCRNSRLKSSLMAYANSPFLSSILQPSLNPVLWFLQNNCLIQETNRKLVAPHACGLSLHFDHSSKDSAKGWSPKGKEG